MLCIDMYYVYKTTCLVNGKFYIGKHKTNDLNDGYVGSGKLLLQAVKKHGKENFVTEIISCHETDKQAGLAERILIVRDREISYNLHEGGNGGWDYLHSIGNHGGKKMRCLFISCKECGKDFFKRKARKSKPITQIFCNKQCSGRAVAKLRYAATTGHNANTRETISKKVVASYAKKTLAEKQIRNDNLKAAHKRNPRIWVTNNLVNVMAFEKDFDVLVNHNFRKGRNFGLKTVKKQTLAAFS